MDKRGNIYIDPTEAEMRQHRLTLMRKSPTPKQAVRRRIGRNDPCPCGSGKKFKRCHGRR